MLPITSLLFTTKVFVTSKVIVNPPDTLATACITPVFAGTTPVPVVILAASVLHVTNIPITGSLKVEFGTEATVIKSPTAPPATAVTLPVKKLLTYSSFLLVIEGLLKSKYV